jgi:hypothetical protein
LFIGSCYSLNLLYQLCKEIQKNQKRITDLGIATIEDAQSKLKEAEKQRDEALTQIENERRRKENYFSTLEQNSSNKLAALEKEQQAFERQIESIKYNLKELQQDKANLETEIWQADSKLEKQKIKFKKSKDLYAAMDRTIKQFYEYNLSAEHFPMLSEEDKAYMDSFAPSVILNLNCMNYQDLRKQFTNNQKQIEEVLKQFEEHYSTKTNRSIYQLMVIALSSELQNILTKLKYGKLEEGLENVGLVCTKYIAIAEEGNQSIVGTVKKFVYTIQSLFEDAVKIEYEYYIKREQARQEQMELKARIKEEREEQKRLAEQAAQMKAESEKYLLEKNRLDEKLKQATSEEEIAVIQKTIADIDTQLADIETKKKKLRNFKTEKPVMYISSVILAPSATVSSR